jgi:hypothetical protein
MATPSGYIMFQGRSAISDQSVVAIATMHSQNDKTGNMVQLWILPSDLSPLAALKSNNNKGACGSCKLQGWFDGKKMQNRVCYVNVGQAPEGIFKAFKRGKYPNYNPKIHAKKIKGRKIRLGAYGDPAALPCELLEHLVGLSAGHTGYSHQLFDIAKTDRPLADRLAKMLMVSCDDNAQHNTATAYGWRTFTVKTPDGTTPADSIQCPFYSHNVQCEDCLLCSGSAKGARSIYVIAHAKTGLNLPKVQAITISVTQSAA